MKKVLFPMFLPKMTKNSKTLKTHWFLILFHPKHQKILGKHRLFSMEASSRFQDFIPKPCKNLGVFKILG
jgi:hypothetical protein